MDEQTSFAAYRPLAPRAQTALAAMADASGLQPESSGYYRKVGHITYFLICPNSVQGMYVYTRTEILLEQVHRRALARAPICKSSYENFRDESI